MLYNWRSRSRFSGERSMPLVCLRRSTMAASTSLICSLRYVSCPEAWDNWDLLTMALGMTRSNSWMAETYACSSRSG